MEDEYQRQSQCEDYEDYGPDGYYPVVLGERFFGKYTVHQKLGWGHFSTVWLASNQVSGQYSALKIQKSKDDYCESAMDQLEMMQMIRMHQEDQQWVKFRKEMAQKHPKLVSQKLCRPLSLLDNFVHHGIHGKHYCSVFELMGPNLLDLIQHYEFKDKRMPMWLVKKITIDILMGLVHLHDFAGIIHTDLKPQNIMMKLHPDQELELIKRIKQYKVKPLSMKYLKNIQASKNSKSKKKNEKKKLKKKQLEANNNANQQQAQQEKQQSQQIPHSQQLSSEVANSKQKPEELISEQSNNQQQRQQTDKSQNKLMDLQPDEATKLKQEAREQKEREEDAPKQQGNQKEVDMSILKWKNMDIKLNTEVFFKIADMGNACFIQKHFTENIQTRQYRSPEVILGHQYYPNTDTWSLACTVFQLLTNNFLFKPKKMQGIPKDEDHMYRIVEVLGSPPKDFAISGTQSLKIFNKKGKLLHGNPKNQLSISLLLTEDFEYEKQEAIEIEKFLLPMLAYEPKNRIGAKEALKSEWLWK